MPRHPNSILQLLQSSNKQKLIFHQTTSLQTLMLANLVENVYILQIHKNYPVVLDSRGLLILVDKYDSVADKELDAQSFNDYQHRS
ncbi:hypothetical protein QYF36_018396 [Acer negundo]|nr:hypothetical protein QYF36_018396 [Acer negundo]